MTTADRISVEEEQRRNELVGRLFQSTVGALELLTLYLGDRLGLYQALAAGGAATASELAARAGTQERYTREWLEQQAAAGILDVDDVEADASHRRYTLPPGHAEALVDQESLNYVAPFGRLMVAGSLPLPSLLQAFRHGGGVPWAAYGADAREAQAAFNRPAFLKLLGQEWLASIPDIHARLQADPPARVADIGCGGGWSSIGIARAYPNVHVDGFDVDEASIALARTNAAEAGLPDRVTFEVRDAGDPALEGRYDLVLACEMVHDLPRPVEVLGSMRKLAADGGAVVVVDERVGERFTAPSDEVERMMYGFSVLCCLAVGMSEQPSAGTGTVMRPATLRRYAVEAGFRDVEILPIEHDLFRFYRLIV